MQIKVKKIIPMMESLNTLNRKELPFSTSFKIAKAVKLLSIDYETAMEKRKEIIDKYGAKDEKGELKIELNGTILPMPDKQEEWNRELKELFDVEVEVDLKPIKLSEFEFKDENRQTTVEPKDLVPLIDLIIEDE